ncbi:fimbrillin family protein [Bacteroides intestinalis]|uniref:Fimbrillin family protein n=2 Tax=Bacteroides intestinalis TaxID=329854 RepID=A0A414L4Q0_9BACE|nr:fimbrillin family protein [Bacteroides intestinalis]
MVKKMPAMQPDRCNKVEREKMMKMKYTDILLASVAALVFLGCDGDGVPEPDTEGNALQLRSVELSDPSVTRALGATQLTKIGVYVTDNAHAALSKNAKSVYELANGTWSSTTPPDITVTNTSTPNRLYAFAPSDLSVTNSSVGNHSVPVQVVADNFNASQQVDYLCATPLTATAASRAVTFTMNHALAKVSFRVSKSANVQETLTLTKIELLSSTSRLQMGSSGTMNLSTGTLNGLASTNSIALEGSTVLSTLQKDPNVSSLVAPMSATETRLSFRLTVNVTETDGSVTPRSFETAVVSAVQWKAGYHYVYAITVDKMGGSLTNVKIDAWKSDANQNTGIGI